MRCSETLQYSNSMSSARSEDPASPPARGHTQHPTGRASRHITPLSSRSPSQERQPRWQLLTQEVTGNKPASTVGFCLLTRALGEAVLPPVRFPSLCPSRPPPWPPSVLHQASPSPTCAPSTKQQAFKGCIFFRKKKTTTTLEF